MKTRTKQCERKGCPNFVEEDDDPRPGRPRRYCSTRCRQLVSQRNRAQRNIQEYHEKETKLRELWKQEFPEETHILEILLKLGGVNLASLVTGWIIYFLKKYR